VHGIFIKATGHHQTIPGNYIGVLHFPAAVGNVVIPILSVPTRYSLKWTGTTWIQEIGENNQSLVQKSRGIPLFSTYGINLFNIDDTSNEDGKYLHTDGTLRSNATYFTTHKIPVSVAIHMLSSNTVPTPMCCFDSNDILVQYSNASELDIPANSAYIRWSLDKAKLSATKIEIGKTRTAYSPWTELYNKQIPAGNVTGLAPLYLNNRVSIPAKLYLLGSNQNTLYHRSILERWIPDMDQLRIENSATAFINNRGFSRITNPTADASVDANLYDLYFNAKDTKNFAIVVGAPATNNGAVTHIGIGDSYMFDGNILKQVRTICPSLTNIGMRKPTNDATSLCEGRGGWTMANYFSTTADVYGTATESHTPLMHPSSGRYFGNVAFWKLYYGGAEPSGYGNKGFVAIAAAIGFDANGYKTNPQNGDIMYDAGYKQYDGSAWQPISTPTFTFSFAKYRSTWGIAAPTFLSVMLGLNDFRNLSLSTIAGSGTTSYTTFKTRMDTLIASVHADSPVVKSLIISSFSKSAIAFRLVYLDTPPLLTSVNSAPASVPASVNAGIVFPLS